MEGGIAERTEPDPSLDGPQEPGVLHYHEVAQPATDKVVAVFVSVRFQDCLPTRKGGGETGRIDQEVRRPSKEGGE